MNDQQDNTVLCSENTMNRAFQNPVLIYIQGGPTGQLIELAFNSQFVIGRGSECELQIDLPSISRVHAKITRDDAEYYIEDLNSTNGTYLERNRISQLTPLTDSVIIRLGEVVFKFLLPSSAEIGFYTELYSIANKDPLTQLYNRRFFEDSSLSLLKFNSRCKNWVSIMLCDIDNFKTVNDTFGHPVGDSVLQKVAGALKNCIRTEDLLARIGGEEFVILLPNTDKLQVIHVANRILSETRKLAFQDLKGPKSITLSLGVSFQDYSQVDFHIDDLNRLVKFADEALYISKNNGKDQYSISTPAN
jgi:two-component system, cell cycle response regulator